jgi:hypothetical protein
MWIPNRAFQESRLDYRHKLFAFANIRVTIWVQVDTSAEVA